jgi:hypothetical protein
LRESVFDKFPIFYEVRILIVAAALRATATAELSYRFSALSWRSDHQCRWRLYDRDIVALRADSHGANKSLKTVGILPAQEAALPAGSCRRLAPPLAASDTKHKHFAKQHTL